MGRGSAAHHFVLRCARDARHCACSTIPFITAYSLFFALKPMGQRKKTVYGMISEEVALSFAGALFKSVWTLELLFLLRRQAEREWRQDEMILDLRSSQVVVAEGLDNLLSAGLAVEIDAGRYRYQSGSPAMEEIIDKLQKIYAMKPAAVIREIVMSPNRKLQILSDAFKFKNE